MPGMAKRERMADLVFEIGCEELPAWAQPKAADELRILLSKHLTAHQLLPEMVQIEVYATPRRLAALCRNVRVAQPETVEEILGPPKQVAFDHVGRPTKALIGFATRHKVSLRQITTLTTKRGEYVVARKKRAGEKAATLLRRILPAVIRELSFPRSMYWTAPDGLHFARPIRWILAAFDGKPVPFEIDGLRSGITSEGHRILCRQAKLLIRHAKEYLPRLRGGFVLADPNERRARIEQQARQLAARRRLQVRPDADLLEELIYLVEFPTVVMGRFDPTFLELPEEILVTVMRGHQKYLALEDRNGQLTASFLAVINLDRDSGAIRQGLERVLHARFVDAQFFWNVDQKRPLLEYFSALEGIVFESRLGTYREKAERLRRLAEWLAERLAQQQIPVNPDFLNRAALLCKCDLVTEMVREFPELQGVVGGLYARSQGEPEEVSWAIYDHYHPAGLDDSIPRNLTGQILALADRIDTLAGCFAVGITPTGSSDPFALRRAALAVVKILFEARLPIKLGELVQQSLTILSDQRRGFPVLPQIERQIRDFLLERARYYLRERFGYSYDEINAALAVDADDLLDAEARISALRAVRRTPTFLKVISSFKRIRNILDQAGGSQQWVRLTVRPELFEHPAEELLFGSLQQLSQRFEDLRRKHNYREALEAMSELQGPVDAFFDQVLVMAKDEAVRANRLALLAQLLQVFTTIADFAELSAE